MDSNYIEIPTPIDEQELYYLYDEFNKKYFNSILPKIKIYTSKLAQKTQGKAKWDFSTNEMAIMIAYSVLNDYKATENIILHEQIHIWQYTMDMKEGKRTYSSPDFIEYFFKNDDKGHNKYFKQWMKDLNSQGFEITITQDDFLDIEMASSCYGIYIVSGDYKTILWNTVSFDPNLILEQYKDRFYDTVDEYQYFETMNDGIFYFPRLAKTGIRKNYKNIFFENWVVDKFMEMAGKILQAETFEKNSAEGEDSELKQKVQSILLQFHKYAKNMDYDGNYGYLPQVLMNLYPETKYMKRKQIEDFIVTIPQYIKDYIEEDWWNITVKDLGNADKLNSSMDDFIRSCLDKKPVSNYWEENFIYALNNIGAYERFKDNEIYEACVINATNILKKWIKKYSYMSKDAGLVKGQESELARNLIEKADVDLLQVIKKGRK